MLKTQNVFRTGRFSDKFGHFLGFRNDEKVSNLDFGQRPMDVSMGASMGVNDLKPNKNVQYISKSAKKIGRHHGARCMETLQWRVTLL